MYKNIPIQYCIVPKCPNAGGNSLKIFIKVPIPRIRRNLWLLSVKRKITDYEGMRAIYVCEDHFDLKNDMFDYEKYMKYKGHKKMKPDIVPHLNIPDQVDDEEIICDKNKKNIGYEIVKVKACSPTTKNIKEYPSEKLRENPLRKYKLIHPKGGLKLTIIRDNDDEIINENSTKVIKNENTLKIIEKNVVIKKEPSEKFIENPYEKTNKISSEIDNKNFSEKINIDSFEKIKKEKYSEIVNENFSEKINASGNQPEQFPQNLVFKEEVEIDEQYDIIKEEYKMLMEPTETRVQVEDDQKMIVDDNNVSNNELASVPEEDMVVHKEEPKQEPKSEEPFTSSPECQTSFITFEPHINSFSYFNISKEDTLIANYLYSHFDISILHSSLFVKKLKTAASFEILAKELNIHESHIIKIYTDSLPKLYKHMKSYIFWPDLLEIQKHLPIYFRKEFKNLESLVDVLQIKIEKPDVILAQSHSWSVNKINKSDQFSLKYLISHTADGLITYVSPGFGGRIYELTMFDFCEYDTYLSPNTQIIVKKMKNASFRGIFPTTKNRVIKADKSSALKSECEKGLDTFLNYKLFHSHLEKILVPYADLIVTIAAAWRNLEKDDDYYETKLKSLR